MVRKHLWINELFDKKLLWLVLVTVGGSFVYLNHTHVLLLEDGYYHSGGSVWGDIAMDMNTINSFVHGPNHKMGFTVHPQSPIFAGHQLATSFFPSFHSALLIVSGLSTRLAILIPNIFLSVSFVGLLYLFLHRFIGRIGLGSSTQSLFHQLFIEDDSASAPSSSSSSSLAISEDKDDKHQKYERQRKLKMQRASIGSSGAAVLGSMLFFLSGGVGFFYWATENRFSLNHDYVESYGPRSEYNLFWFASIPHILLPQRNSIYAYPLVILVLTALYEGIRPSASVTDRLRLFFLAGITAALIPMFQVQSFGAVLIIAVGLVASKPSEVSQPKSFASWFVFIFPVITFGLTQIAYFLVGARRAETLKVELVPSDQWIIEVFGQSIVGSLIGPFVFWIRALGLFVPLALIGTLTVRHQNQRRFALSAWILFVFANLVRFQSWKNDNLKFFSVFMIIMVGVVAILLVRVIRSFRFPPVLKVLAIFAIITMILSGGLALRREFTNYNVYHSPADYAVGEWAQKSTSPNAVFLVTNKHNHPISTVGGRTLFAGFAGWLHGHGYDDWEDRVKEQDKILNGEEDAKDLLQKNNINYLVFEFKEQATHAYLKDYPIVYDNQYVVFEISRKN